MSKFFKGVMLFSILFLTGTLFSACKSEIIGLRVDQENFKNLYYINEQIDYSGLKVYAIYENETEEELKWREVSFSKIDTATEGQKELTITYDKFSTTIYITVEVYIPEVVDIEIDDSLFKKEYILDEKLDFSTIKVYEKYENDYLKEIASEDLNNAFRIYADEQCQIETDMSKKGVKYIKVSYQGFYKSIQIFVKVAPEQRKIVALSINDNAMEQIVLVGRQPDYSKVKISVIYNDDSIENIDNKNIDFTIVGDINEMGKKELVAKYKDVTSSVYFYCVEPDSIEYDLNTVSKTAIMNQEYKTENIKVYALIGETKKVLLNANEYEIVPLNTAQEGEQELVCNFRTRQVKTIVNVYHSINDTYKIAEFKVPEFVDKLSANRAEQENKQNEFYERFNLYKVGSDNPFVFMPVVTVFDEGLEKEHTIIAKTIRQKIKVFVIEGVDRELTTDLNDYVTIEEHKGIYQFKDLANGKRFRIEVLPYYDVDYKEKLIFEFEVVDAYNIYTAKDMSVLDNKSQAWKDWRVLNNIEEKVIKGAVFQSDIILNKSDVPKNFYYNAEDDDTKQLVDKNPEILNSLRDHTTLYDRYVENNETFILDANYFTLDISAFPLINYFPGSYTSAKVTHSQVLRFQGLQNEKPVFSIKNLNFIGNANRSEDVKKAGGLILLKAENCVTSATNCIAKSAAIAWFASQNSVFNLDKVKVYDCYSNHIYSYKKSEFNITNSEMKNCGGPVLMSNHDESNKMPNDYLTASIDNNTIIESYVTGQETWFKSLSNDVLDLTTTILALDDYVRYASNNKRTFTKEIQVGEKTVKCMNLLYVLYDTTNFLNAGTATKCDINIGDDRFDLATPNNKIATYRNKRDSLEEKPQILQVGKKCLYLMKDETALPHSYRLKDFTPRGIEEVSPIVMSQFFNGGDTLKIVYNSCIGIMLKLENIK